MRPRVPLYVQNNPDEWEQYNDLVTNAPLWRRRQPSTAGPTFSLTSHSTHQGQPRDQRGQPTSRSGLLPRPHPLAQFVSGNSGNSDRTRTRHQQPQGPANAVVGPMSAFWPPPQNPRSITARHAAHHHAQRLSSQWIPPPPQITPDPLSSLLERPRPGHLPYIRWDLAKHPNEIQHVSTEGIVSPLSVVRRCNERATASGSTTLYIFIPYALVGWGPVIVSGSGSVKVSDIINATHQYFQRKLWLEDIVGVSNAAEVRNGMKAAHDRRRGGGTKPVSEMLPEYKRIDMLMGRTMFLRMFWQSSGPGGNPFLTIEFTTPFSPFR